LATTKTPKSEQLNILYLLYSILLSSLAGPGLEAPLSSYLEGVLYELLYR